MKTFLTLLILATPLMAADVEISPAALAAIRQASPMSQMTQPKEGEAKVIRPDGQSLLNSSVLLHDGTHWTLVPKGAVVHIPKIMKDRVTAKPVGELLSWTEFLALNQGWISTCEVSFEQASGKVPLDPKKVEFWQKQDKIMVAVHLGGPISVAPGSESTQTPAISQR